MSRQKKLIAITAAISLMAAPAVFAEATITVNADQPGHAVSPWLWGIFFEDINLSADGGLYSELVRNRSFEDSNQPADWTFGSRAGGNSTVVINTNQPLNAFNTHNLRIKVDGAFTLQNEGYWGMNIAQGDTYQLKLAARVEQGFDGPLTVKILSSTGQVLGAAKITGLTGNWRYHTLQLTASGTDPKARLEISGSGRGSLYLDMVSLMPEKTWKGHGLRPDLAQALADLHPSFMRFPGGNWIEGDDIEHMYHWKYTIGDIDSRTPLWNTWGYNTTQGLGFYEYLQLCEDLGAEPLFDISDGMSLHDAVPLTRMGEWIQDALDAIEYANGPTNTVWGALRAQAGHPAPFHLRIMEIGNENGGPDYVQRWPLLVNAIRAKYPDMQLIMTTDLRGRPYPRNPAPDMVDEHYYESPESFMRRATQYDSYDRSGPNIFVGEYAVTEKAGQGNMRAAVGEAAFMTGMERNSDKVKLASYAPLFVNLNHRAWNPDLINFDSSRWYGIPSYYVQQMFSASRGDVTLPVQVDTPDAVRPPSKGMIGVGTWNTEAEFKDIKVISPDGQVLFASDFSQQSDGWKKLGSGAQWDVLDGALRQSAEHEFSRAIAGNPEWTDYTLTLKARKLGGREGFLILFHITNDDDRIWWNLGGWGNTQDAIQNGVDIDAKPSQIETSRWYGLRVEVSGKRVKCFCDGQLVHDVAYESDDRLKALYASATEDHKTGDVIVKVVNTSANPLETKIDLSGARNLTGKGEAIMLTSASPADENTLDHPTKVSPVTQSFNFQGKTYDRVFPGNSVNVLRFGTKSPLGRPGFENKIADFQP